MYLPSSPLSPKAREARTWDEEEKKKRLIDDYLESILVERVQVVQVEWKHQPRVMFKEYLSL